VLRVPMVLRRQVIENAVKISRKRVVIEKPDTLVFLVRSSLVPYRRRRSSSLTPSPERPTTRGSEDRGLRVSSAAALTDRFARRLLILLIGIWFGSILVTVLAVPRSFHSVDVVMADPAPEAAKAIREIGPVRARMVLHHQISEANRMLLAWWGWAQMGLGLLVFGIVLFGTRSGRVAIGLAGAMLLVAVATQFLLIPRLHEISRATDFTPAMAASPNADRFLVLHRGFAAFEAVVGVLGTVLLGLLFRRSDRSMRPGRGKVRDPDAPYGEQFN
jgi:hypothetical protein